LVRPEHVVDGEAETPNGDGAEVVKYSVADRLMYFVTYKAKQLYTVTVITKPRQNIFCFCTERERERERRQYTRQNSVSLGRERGWLQVETCEGNVGLCRCLSRRAGVGVTSPVPCAAWEARRSLARMGEEEDEEEEGGGSHHHHLYKLVIYSWLSRLFLAGSALHAPT
jgi:hypothetical protein